MMKALAGAMIIAVLAATGAQATVIFDFNNNNPLDGASVGDSFTTNGLTLTVTELTDWRGDLGSANSAIVLNSTSANSLGVNSPSPNPPNASSDPRDFDPNESWTFTFDQPVTIDFMNASSIDSPAEMTISSSAFATQVIGADDWTDDDIDFATLLGGAVVSAGTEITIKNTSAESVVGNSHDWRVQELHVTVIPEPATISLVGLSLAVLICVRRSRRV